ncbi:exodeoxyribonuclease V beta chain [Vibrio variabilis]|uniref:Exodeoxyribonuclease V beta chain n=1 Tax=Vibrio variabilis TaxID=990271 RepID=A0ABQ0JMV6_9VIBR|nr:exodeoxyribonuclease V beta chain [Vibrio variabilis]
MASHQLLGLVKQSSHGSSDEVFIEESGLDIDSSDDEQLDPLLEPEKTIFHFPKSEARYLPPHGV